jgi:hypothetical protein
MGGIDYLSGGGPRFYDCDQGTLYVRNVPAVGGGFLLGVFEAELAGRNGEPVRTYKV